jgi:catechol 2,3-dioxygenase-like lactoylglutathione lyase family enzyme
MTGSSLPAKVGALSLFIDDVARSKAFYGKVFAADPLFEDETSVAYRFGDAVLNLTARSGASELIEPRAVADPSGGTTFMLTIWVADCDAACATLASHGVPLLNGPIDRPWGVRTATFQDPDGHVWEVAQQLG